MGNVKSPTGSRRETADCSQEGMLADQRKNKKAALTANGLRPQRETPFEPPGLRADSRLSGEQRQPGIAPGFDRDSGGTSNRRIAPSVSN